MKLLLAIPARALSAGLSLTSPPTQRAESISFTVIVEAFNQTGSGTGGGICRGSRRATDPKRVDGGPGRDSAWVDRRRDVLRSVERRLG
ncbi:MAG: hypothetical protein ABR583_03455 [Gaiellaceae bacterium]